MGQKILFSDKLLQAVDFGFEKETQKQRFLKRIELSEKTGNSIL